jgi:hypothetical protein
MSKEQETLGKELVLILTRHFKGRIDGHDREQDKATHLRAEI